MKKVVFFVVISLFVQSVVAQKKNDSVLQKYDLSSIWQHTDNASVLGFIGDNYQRLQVKLLTVYKGDDKIYMVRGRTKVKEVVCSFSGPLVIDEEKKMVREFEDANGKMTKQETFEITGRYFFTEDTNCTHWGLFYGTFVSSFYINEKGQIKYDDLTSYSDGFSNNQFQGIWVSHKTAQSKTCNWGDYRIPQSGDLDIGAGEFSPDDKYLRNGWQTYRDAYVNNDSNAKKIEESEWWK